MGRQGRGGYMGRNRSSGPTEMNTVYFWGVILVVFVLLVVTEVSSRKSREYIIAEC